MHARALECKGLNKQQMIEAVVQFDKDSECVINPNLDERIRFDNENSRPRFSKTGYAWKGTKCKNGKVDSQGGGILKYRS